MFTQHTNPKKPFKEEEPSSSALGFGCFLKADDVGRKKEYPRFRN